MLTRLKVKGFKNLVDVDVRFGPFTCIAGPNNVGKSNLFDAIRFLSALADRTLTEAALGVRDEAGRAADLRGLFHRVGDEHADQMSFEAEMIVPATGTDDLGQATVATTTFLRYSLILGYREDERMRSSGPLELLYEELTYLRKGDAQAHLLFPHGQAWRASAVTGQRHGKAYISTTEDGGSRIVELHQDGRAGRPLRRLAESLPRTVLSATNATESPTAVLARQEMRSWRLLQLEPTALRRPDELTAPTTLGEDGAHLPATLYHLARAAYHGEAGDITTEVGEAAQTSVYGQIAVRLYGLVQDILDVAVDRDEKRELLTLVVTDRAGTAYPARALSDGTLRFLALSVLELDKKGSGLWCLEEPENGIHPARIPAMLDLLREIATDVTLPLGQANPLRQVIINTHSPTVVGLVPEDSLLVAQLAEYVSQGRRYSQARFSALPETWRQKAVDAPRPVALGTLLDYLSPIDPRSESDGVKEDVEGVPERSLAPIRRVIDRPEFQRWLFGPDSAGA